MKCCQLASASSIIRNLEDTDCGHRRPSRLGVAVLNFLCFSARLLCHVKHVLPTRLLSYHTSFEVLVLHKLCRLADQSTDKTFYVLCNIQDNNGNTRWVRFETCILFFRRWKVVINLKIQTSVSSINLCVIIAFELMSLRADISA